MYGLRTRYLASVFVDADDLTPTKHFISDLMEAFGDEEFIPDVRQEPTPLGVKQRIGFRDLDGSRVLALNGQRFDFMRLPLGLEKGDRCELGEFDSFCEEAARKLVIAIDYFARKAHRLAAVQEGFLRDMSEDVMGEIAERLLKLPQFYCNSSIFEWDWRVASLVERHMAELVELTNNITTVRRSTGHLLLIPGGQQMKQIDGIRVDFDINTNPGNSAQRFGNGHIKSFFEQAPAWHGGLSSEVFSHMSGSRIQ
jgi:hypothetical protein